MPGWGMKMDWLSEVESKMKRKNQILFTQNSDFLADLTVLIQQQNHRTLVLWAFEFADEMVTFMLEKYPNEHRLESALFLSKEWAAGKVKMPMAKRAILNAHAAAKEMSIPEDIALCHSVGQACSVVHTRRHAMGFPIYELTSLVREYGFPECKTIVEERKQQYIDRLLFWQEQTKEDFYQWADFLRKDI